MIKCFLFSLFFIGINLTHAQTKQDSSAVKHSKKDKVVKAAVQDSSIVKPSKQNKGAKQAPVDSVTAKNWRIHGSNSLSINQTSFSNWILGGTNNLTVDVRLNYDFNYEKDNWSIDNKVLLTYGFNKQKANTLKKTDDRIEITSILGKKINEVWNYSGYMNFKTQFDKGIDPKDPKNKISHFFSPVFFQFGPGIFWKKHDNFKINVSPAAPRFVFVHSEFTKNGKSFGVSREEVMLFEFGASLYTYYKFNIMKNISMENIFLAYANYFNNTKGVDFDYQGTISMKVNKFFSANIYYEALYDFESLEMLQQKQSIGVGLKYAF